jgi:hypothetical protein
MSVSMLASRRRASFAAFARNPNPAQNCTGVTSTQAVTIAQRASESIAIAIAGALRIAATPKRRR